jgi:hypothetical protein
MRFEFEVIRKETQEALIQFLNAELKLGRTQVQSALLAKDDRHEEAKRVATKAAETVERFKAQVVDAKARSEISKRLVYLRELISTL